MLNTLGSFFSRLRDAKGIQPAVINYQLSSFMSQDSRLDKKGLTSMIEFSVNNKKNN